jgi:hypothetical protein
MEVWGGNGYVETGPMARLYREAPVNSIWEGSGNVMCLDVLRAIGRETQGFQLLLQNWRTRPARMIRWRSVNALKQMLGARGRTRACARRLVQQLVLALQGMLMLRHAPAGSADAFLASRGEGDGGRVTARWQATVCRPSKPSCSAPGGLIPAPARFNLVSPAGMAAMASGAAFAPGHEELATARAQAALLHGRIDQLGQGTLLGRTHRQRHAVHAQQHQGIVHEGVVSRVTARQRRHLRRQGQVARALGCRRWQWLPHGGASCSAMRSSTIR